MFTFLLKEMFDLKASFTDEGTNCNIWMGWMLEGLGERINSLAQFNLANKLALRFYYVSHRGHDITCTLERLFVKMFYFITAPVIYWRQACEPPS